MTLEQAMQESLLSGAKSYRSMLNLYVKSLNKRPNRKSLLKSPYRHDNDVSTASILMREPTYAIMSLVLGPTITAYKVYRGDVKIGTNVVKEIIVTFIQ